jgi:hypothetical protein
LKCEVAGVVVGPHLLWGDDPREHKRKFRVTLGTLYSEGKLILGVQQGASTLLKGPLAVEGGVRGDNHV